MPRLPDRNVTHYFLRFLFGRGDPGWWRRGLPKTVRRNKDVIPSLTFRGRPHLSSSCPSLRTAGLLLS